MDRRTIIRAAAGTLVAACLSARGQQPDKVWRVGILDPGIPHLFAAFRESMRDLGYVEGRNIRFVEKNANGYPDLVRALARELVALKPDVIVTAATLPTHSLLSETATIPLVVAAIGDAVSAGIVRNLAQPKGNVTGLTFLNAELSAKRLEPLKEALPRLSRVAAFNDVNSQQSYLDETERAASDSACSYTASTYTPPVNSSALMQRRGGLRTRLSTFSPHRSSMQTAFASCNLRRGTTCRPSMKAGNMPRPAAS
jgi:ABC-type uncharacterized transport system substrate-binding protein